MRPSVAVLGCGNRGGDVYVPLLQECGAEVTYLADPQPERLQAVARRAGVPSERCLSRWADFFALGRVADAVVIATPDHDHVQPCLAALALGYHVLLEKPVCLREEELDLLLAAEAVSAGRVTVCHVLRHTPFFQAVTGVLFSGRLGQLVGIQHAENVAFWHYAHSFVRGNWRQSPQAAPFILAKACHDLDLLRWFAASVPTRVTSEGSRLHFRPENKPAEATGRCLSCPLGDCAYDARRIYAAFAPDEWPNTVLTAGGQTVAEALARGPYGECVYNGQNDVIEHQAVTATFQNGVVAQLTVSAFTHNNTRTLKLLGTRGELRGQMERGEVEVFDFASGQVEVVRVSAEGRHGGGDRGLVEAWLAFLRGVGQLPTPLAESLDSHRMAFAAERSRLGV